jgi:hypothetical protein
MLFEQLLKVSNIIFLLHIGEKLEEKLSLSEVLLVRLLSHHREVRLLINSKKFALRPCHGCQRAKILFTRKRYLAKQLPCTKLNDLLQKVILLHDTQPRFEGTHLLVRPPAHIQIMLRPILAYHIILPDHII